MRIIKNKQNKAHNNNYINLLKNNNIFNKFHFYNYVATGIFRQQSEQQRG